MDTKQEYIEIIKMFTQKTETGIINWKRQNPTTLYFETRNDKGERTIVSLQKVQDRAYRRDNDKRFIEEKTLYVFTVKNSSSNELIVQIDSKSQKEYQEYFAELFLNADYKIEKRSIDVLREIMGNLE